MNFEEMIRTQKGIVKSALTGSDIEVVPDFRVSVQGERDGGVHIIVHADGYDSETLDFVVKGNELSPI